MSDSSSSSSSSKRAKPEPGPSRRVLVTGGAGYIGSHCVLELLRAGFACVALDSLDNSNVEAVRRVRELAFAGDEDEGASADRLVLVQCDLTDLEATREAVRANGPFFGCIHFAAFKAVGESVNLPMHYYYNNVVGTMNLIMVLRECGVFRLVFSSSCTVYGNSTNVPMRESEPISTAFSPYGSTKIIVEQMLKDLCAAPNNKFQVVMLRYFNPVGAHASGRIGDDPLGIPCNLLPVICQVAVGKRAKLSVFGGDYPTPDGTCVRDYVHVMDVARAHVNALEKVSTLGGGPEGKQGTIVAYNIGTGKGSSVLEVVRAFELASNTKIPYEICPRRAGDVVQAYCDPELARKELGFECQLTLDDACRDAWRWQTQNPYGYRTSKDEDDGPRKAKVFALLKAFTT